jgi:hypothetical protein
MPKMAIITIILRMSRKYDCKNLRKDVLSRFSSEYPSTLEDWDATRANYTRISGDPGVSFDVVNAAAENSFNRVLPTAFFSCIESFSLVSIQPGLLYIYVEMKFLCRNKFLLVLNGAMAQLPNYHLITNRLV